MAVSTVGSLSEIFTAGVPLQTEEHVQNADGTKEKSGSPNHLAPITEDVEDVAENGTTETMDDKHTADDGDESSKMEDGGDEESDGDEDEGDVLQVHG